jgi:hypothetical protein
LLGARRLCALVLTVAGACAAAQAGAAEGVFAHPADAARLATLTRATARSLDGAQVVRGRFEQRRFLAGLRNPLTSSGNFLFARDAGIEWHTEEPFDSQFVLTRSGITQRDEGGTTLRIEAAEQPALAVVSRVFFALFALDLGALSNDFELYGRARGADGWELGLEPRAGALGSVFRRAIVTGGSSVERVVLEDGNGDRSEIDLRQVQYDRAPLTSDERARF